MATHAQYFEIATREMLAANPALSEDVIRTEGTDYNTIANGIAAAAAEVSYQVSERDRAAYLDTATAEALSRWVNDRYGITRKGATAAVVEVSLVRLGSASNLTVPAGTTIRTAAGVKFRTDVALSFVTGGDTSQVVQLTSTAAGRSQNVLAGALIQFEGGAPETGMTIVQAEAAAGGNDRETDEQLKARARSFFINARRAIVSAIVQGALDVPQVREAAAWEDLDPQGNPAGSVSLIIADESGASNSTLTAAVVANLLEWRPAGVPVTVTGATVVYADIAATATWAQGAGTAANKAILVQAIVARVNTLDPNGAPTAADAPAQCLLTPGLIEKAGDSVPGLLRLVVTSPAGIEAPDHGRVIRTSTGRVAIT